MIDDRWRIDLKASCFVSHARPAYVRNDSIELADYGRHERLLLKASRQLFSTNAHLGRRKRVRIALLDPHNHRIDARSLPEENDGHAKHPFILQFDRTFR